MISELDEFIAIPCPECGTETEVLVSEIIRGIVVVCRGCLQTISVEDSDGELGRAIQKVQDVFREWGG